MPTSFEVTYEFLNNYGGTPANIWNNQSKKKFGRTGTTSVSTYSYVATDTGWKAAATPCLQNTVALRATATDLTGKYDLYSVDVTVKGRIVETCKNKGAITRIKGGLAWRIVDNRAELVQKISTGEVHGNSKKKAPVAKAVSTTYSMYMKKGVSTFIGGCITAGGLQIGQGAKDFEASVSVTLDMSLTIDIKDVWTKNKDGSYRWGGCKTTKVTKAKKGKTISLPMEEQGIFDHFGKFKKLSRTLFKPDSPTSIKIREPYIKSVYYRD